MDAPQEQPAPTRLQRLSNAFTPSWRLTLFGRSLLLLVGELAANLLVWVTALALFAPDPIRRSVCLIQLSRARADSASAEECCPFAS